MKVDVIYGFTYGIQQYLSSYKYESTNETGSIRTKLNSMVVLLGTPNEILIMLL